MNLDGKAGTRLLELHQRAISAQREAVVRQSEAWRAELAGGAEEVQHAAAREFMASLGDNSLRQCLDESGAGNNPALVRFVIRLARELNGVRR